jgi:trans-aconitate methyltransferase
MAKHGNETAELFDDVWRSGTYSGFSHNTRGESSTPFLDSFLREVRALRARAPKIVELGAGSCDHALRCAREGFPTTAVEYSSVAIAEAIERVRSHPDLPLEIVQADLFAFTAQLPANHLAGLYANSVFHFLSPEERRNQYRVLRGVLVERGVLAISFKAHGDALERRGSVVEETAAGAVVKGDDGIRRLFVARVDALADEMRDAGFAIHRTIRWSVPGYNVGSESGEFVGLLALRS